VEKGPAGDPTGAPQPYGFLCNPMMKIIIMIIIIVTIIIIIRYFPSNGTPVE
jgi:hypothetical protein